MKKVLLVLLALLIALPIAAPAYAVRGNNAISANSVSFSTTARIASFNTTVNELILINEDPTDTVWVQVTNLGHVTGLTSTVRYPDVATAIRVLPATSMDLQINTDMIGWITNAGEGTLTYIGFSDTGEQP